MPPHCDTRDGPVVTAATRALDTGNVNDTLPYVPVAAEDELRTAFARTLRVRASGGDAAALANEWFFETAVRLHRAGEGAPYTGLKPAGLDWGPVVRRADAAIEQEDPTDVISFLTDTVAAQLRERFDRAMSLKEHDVNDVPAARAYVSAMLGFVLYSHHLWKYVTSGEALHKKQ